jgi:hypothetical protein
MVRYKPVGWIATEKLIAGYSTCCQEKAIKEAYHVLCDNCARTKGVCAKCLESKDILVR